MDFIEELRQDNDIEGAVLRLGGNESLYRSICTKFINDTNFNEYEKSRSKEEYISARLSIHTLKGIAVNLGFLKLAKLCGEIQDSMSSDDYDGLKRKEAELSEEYHRIVGIISLQFRCLAEELL